MGRKQEKRGSAMVEFTLAGVAAIVTLVSTFNLAMGMWNYHMLTSAVHETTRYAAVKGINCTKPGNSCSVSVGTLAHKVEEFAIGVPSDSLNLTLTTDSGAATPCSPLSNCFSDTTVWPPHTNNDNRVGSSITISAVYQFRAPLLSIWPGAGSQRFGEVWLRSASTQKILF